MWKKSKQKHFKNLSVQCSSNRNNYQIFQIGWIPIGFSQGEKRVWLCAHTHTHAHKVYFFSQTQQGGLGGISRAEYFRTVLFRSPAMRRVPSFCFLRQYTSILFPWFPFLFFHSALISGALQVGSNSTSTSMTVKKTKYGANETEHNLHHLLHSTVQQTCTLLVYSPYFRLISSLLLFFCLLKLIKLNWFI